MLGRIHFIIWAVIAVIAFYFLKSVSAILFPFIMAFVLSYLLDPIVDYLTNRYKVSRAFIALSVVGAFFLVMIGLLLTIIPIIFDQINSFIRHIPNYKATINEKIIPYVSTIIHDLDPELVVKVKESIESFTSEILHSIGRVLSSLWNSGLAFVNIASMVLITPIVMFYILRDWWVLIDRVEKLIPKKRLKYIRKLFGEIDDVLSGYIRGQLNVCLMMGVFYAAMLMIFNVQFGLFIGFATGILTFIPYLGAFTGAAIAAIATYAQYGEISTVAMVLVLFIAGQTVEGNFITPKLIGDKIGLHPVWMIFAMLAGATLAGFTGMLLAIPVAAIIGVIIKEVIAYYLQSNLYLEKNKK